MILSLGVDDDFSFSPTKRRETYVRTAAFAVRHNSRGRECLRTEKRRPRAPPRLRSARMSLHGVSAALTEPTQAHKRGAKNGERSRLGDAAQIDREIETARRGCRAAT